MRPPDGSRFLLDTHVFLWLHSDPARLPPPLLEVLGDPAQELLLSVASAWEIGLKYSLQRLPLPQEPRTWVPDRLAAIGATVLPVALPHVLEAAALPLHHKDPFDRLLVAQARLDGLTLVTGDALLSRYDVALAWA